MKYLLGQSVVFMMLIMLMVSCGQHDAHTEHADHEANMTSATIEPTNSVVKADVVKSESSAKVMWQSLSKNEAFSVAIYPADGELLVGRFQDWVVEVHDANGQPVNNALVVFNGGMPSHGHGMASDPEVTSYDGDGKYGVEGVKFTMAGPWQMDIVVQTSAMTDKATFNIEVKY